MKMTRKHVDMLKDERLKFNSNAEMAKAIGVSEHVISRSLRWLNRSVSDNVSEKFLAYFNLDHNEWDLVGRQGASVVREPRATYGTESHLPARFIRLAEWIASRSPEDQLGYFAIARGQGFKEENGDEQETGNRVRGGGLPTKASTTQGS